MKPRDFKVVMLAPSISRQGGGLFDATRRLAQELHILMGDRLQVFGLRDPWAGEDAASWMPVRPHIMDTKGFRAFGYAPELHQRLAGFKPDILHTVGLWMYPSLAAAQWTKKTGARHLVSPHGMLDSWALLNSRWKKRLAAWCYENDHLRSAACLHALCDEEAQAVRAYGLVNPVCVIPNGVDIPAPITPGKSDGLNDLAPGKNILLYLGRLHPKKGLPLLIKVWAEVQKEKAPGSEAWVLAISGWDQGGHEQDLKQLVRETGCPASAIVFPGPQYGAQKDRWFRRSSAFVLPSLSEGLPMVVLEAWAYQLPVLMTPACNLPEGFSLRAALKMETNSTSMAQVVRELLAMDQNARAEMGRCGWELVRDRYQWKNVANKMLAV
ncbi:MAG: glycosyltransferase, partial [Lentisphaerota bacterium]